MSDDNRIGMTIAIPPTTVATVSSLDDRRKIASLEKQNAELEAKLAAALRTVQPAMDIERIGCRHYGGTIVSDNSQSITCKACGDELDPYEVLRRIAHEETRFCYQLNSLREERKKLTEEVERLKSQRSSIARRVRRGKDAPPAGFATRLREAGIGEIGIRRIGKTNEWSVAVKRAQAGPHYGCPVAGADAWHGGVLEDAIEAALGEVAVPAADAKETR